MSADKIVLKDKIMWLSRPEIGSVVCLDAVAKCEQQGVTGDYTDTMFAKNYNAPYLPACVVEELQEINNSSWGNLCKAMQEGKYLMVEPRSSIWMFQDEGKGGRRYIEREELIKWECRVWIGGKWYLFKKAACSQGTPRVWTPMVTGEIYEKYCDELNSLNTEKVMGSFQSKVEAYQFTSRAWSNLIILPFAHLKTTLLDAYRSGLLYNPNMGKDADWIGELSSQLEQATPRDWYYFNRALGPIAEFCRLYRLKVSIAVSGVDNSLPYINSFTPTLMSEEQRANVVDYVPSIHLTFYVNDTPAAKLFEKLLRYAHYSKYVTDIHEVGLTVCSNQLIFQAAGKTQVLVTDKPVLIISMIKRLLDSIVLDVIVDDKPIKLLLGSYLKAVGTERWKE